MKILNIVIHNSEYKEYERMYEILSPYYKNQLGLVDTLFIEYSENSNSQTVFVGDKLRIKGVESMVPGLLWKTLDALLFLSDSLDSYDFIVRSNVSTLINFQRLKSFIDQNPGVNYVGGQIEVINWLDPMSGITNNKWWGTPFAQGTLIGLSLGLCKLILNMRHKLHFELVDDVAIGVFMHEYLKEELLYQVPISQFVLLGNSILGIQNIMQIEELSSPIAWRNKSVDRSIDIENMMNIALIQNLKRLK